MSAKITGKVNQELVNDFITVIEGLLPLTELMLSELTPFTHSPEVCKHIEKAQMNSAAARAFIAKYGGGKTVE